MSATILQKIVETKKQEVAAIKDTDFGTILPSTRNFKASLTGKNNIIAEIKKKSPSEGIIREDFDPTEIAHIYDKYANAISVLTDKEYFAGDLEYLKQVSEVTKLPLLRKDFIIDAKQVEEARAYGADAILLIAAILSAEEIDALIDEAKKYNMDALVEVHTEEELQEVLKTKVNIIGINNRNLDTFDVSLDTTTRLMEMIPKDRECIVVSESGINTLADIEKINTNAVLIGTSFMKSPDIKEKLVSMRRPKIKICGVTNLEDTKQAVEAGADMIGFNFYKKSPRYIESSAAKEIIAQLPNIVTNVGVFVDEDTETVQKIIQETGIDMIQLHGHEDQAYCDAFSVPVIKAIHVKDSSPEEESTKYKTFAQLYDTFDEKLLGGTGKAFDPSLIKDLKGKTILSGGLNAENVGEAVKLLNPYAVDVCSGVEKEKGIKDYEKVTAFIEKIKN